MRFLLVSYFFAPQNAMGAVRPTKLAKYLVRMGHEVTVLCGVGMDGSTDPALARDLEALDDVRVIEEWNPLRAHKAKKAAEQASAQPAAARPEGGEARRASAAARAAHGCMDAAYRLLRLWADRSFQWRATKALKTLDGRYDVVFSTYAPYSVHPVARAAKRRGVARCWIADFRDEVGMPFAWQTGRKRRYLQMLRREADVLCAASQGFLEMMGFEDRGRVLSNGFDREDLPAGEALQSAGQLRAVYCGLLSMGRKGVPPRDLTPAFRALRRLADEGVIDMADLRLVYAGREGALFMQQAAACGLEGCVEDHGYVSREESIRLQRGADLLLMASWHMASQRGILTGKLFEYLMMDKPIVCCMSGDLPNSGVRDVLIETGMGICCEQAGGAGEEQALYAYLCTLAQAWKQGKTLLMSKQTQTVETYAYPALAKVLAGWAEECLSQHPQG